MCGLPLQPGEDERADTPSNPVTRELLERVCQTASITLPPSAIDVCHRLGNERRSPIIIRFTSKSARYLFFSQRYKLTKISTLDVNYTNLPVIPQRDATGGDRGGHTRARWTYTR